MTHNVSRRTLAKGAAWAAPAVVATTAIPAYAASCDSKLTQKITDIYTNYLDNVLPDLTGWNIGVWFEEASMENASLGNSSINFKPVTKGANVNFANFPLMWDLRFKNVDTSPAVNNTLDNNQNFVANYDGWGNIKQTLLNPWPANGYNNNGIDATAVDSCSQTRSFNFSSSNVYAINPLTGQYLGGRSAPSIGVNNTMMTCLGTSYGTTLATRSLDLDGSANEQLINIQWGDGYVIGTQKIFTAVGIAPLGFAPPLPTYVETELKKDPAYKKVDFSQKCIQDQINAENQAWILGKKGLKGMEFTAYGWAGDYAGDGQQVHQPSADGVAWSHEIGNYLKAIDRIANWRIRTAPQLQKDNFWRNTLMTDVQPVKWRDGIW